MPAPSRSDAIPAHDNLPYRSGQLIEQSLRLLQILGVETFGEPVVDWGEQLIRLVALALALPQSREAGRRAEFRLLRAYVNASSSTLASVRSGVSKPSTKLP